MKALTRRGFRAWLARHKPETLVGHSGIAHRCPLARYISTLSGHMAGVSALYYRPDVAEDARVMLPEWASSFVLGIDEGGDIAPVVTAARALRVLDEVPWRGQP